MLEERTSPPSPLPAPGPGRVAAGTKGKKGGFVVLWSAAGGLRRLHRDPPRAAAAAAAAGSPPPLTVGADPSRPPQAVAVNDAGTPRRRRGSDGHI